MFLSPDARLGHYRIVGPLGVGGMGEVYRATDTRLGRDVAVKVLPAAVAADARRLARFEQEARTVASLNHPNIVTLFSVEDAEGVRFLTMELVEGESLERHVVPGGLPAERVADIGTALADALSAAHEQGVVHRDLKPANVMLTRSGQIKVLDFGLATLESGPESGDTTAGDALDVTVASPLTADGQVVGTVPYMAPEQVRGEAVDSRTDLFALGIVLYELVTGRRPFQGNTAGVISTSILRDEPPLLTAIRADVPRGLERIIARCLEKDPGARYQTARELEQDLRGGAGATASAASASRSGAGPASVRKPPPEPSTPLLGREEHVLEAIGRVQGGARVLTVTGYGGTGKTRFSIELYRRLAPGFPGGSAFVSLASVTAADEVMPTIGATLDIAEAEGRAAVDALATVIGDRRMLLVLDNLEQVLDAAGDLASLVSRCPALRVIATSRAPLKIGAESEFALPPLELPGAGEESPEALGACPSVALFVQRAVKVKPAFALTAGNAPAVAAICRRLDGLPLALELAAARVRILEPDQLLQRLDHALDLLTSGDRDLPLRQRTLRAAISWSYSLLDAAEQRLLRALSVFHEGWTLEALEQVCYAGDDRYRALDELDSLVEKGLVRVIGSGERYSLLETIRAFSAEQLHAGGEVEAVRDAHAAYYLELAAGVQETIFTPEQLEALARAQADQANLLAAIHWRTAGARAGNRDALEQALLLCGYLNWVWHIGGLHLTGRALVEPLLALAADGPPTRGRALAHLAAGMIATTTGEWERARHEWATGGEEGVAVGDPLAAAEGPMGAGYCCLGLELLDDARAALDVAIARSADESLAHVRGLALSMKGMLFFLTGDLAGGMALVEEARGISRRLRDYEGGGIALSFLAQMTQAQGDPERALELYREALASFETVGDHPEIARVHCEMGWAALAAENGRAARRAFRNAVQTYEEVGSPRGTGLALLGLAAVDAAEGLSERAVSIAAAAHALSERAGVVVAHPMDPGVVRRIEELKASIPERTVEGLLAEAATLSPASILAMLAETGDGAR